MYIYTHTHTHTYYIFIHIHTYTHHNCRYKVKRNVLSVFLKSSKLLIDLMSGGKPFQSLGATAQKALSPYGIVLVRGITNKF